MYSIHSCIFSICLVKVYDLLNTCLYFRKNKLRPIMGDIAKVEEMSDAERTHF